MLASSFSTPGKSFVYTEKQETILVAWGWTKYLNTNLYGATADLDRPSLQLSSTPTS